MPTSYTTNLRLSNPGLGDTGWGSTVSNGMIDLVDPAIAGTTTLSADTDVILTTANGMTDQARQMILNCTGSRAAQRTITAPASSKVYVVINGTTGGFGVKIVGVGPTTGVVVPAGRMALLAWNGSDFVTLGAVVDLTASGNVTVAGTTTLSAGTANGVLYLNGSKVATSGSALTFDGSRIALGTATSNIQLTTTVNTNQAYISLSDADARTAVFRGPNNGAPNCAQIGTTTNHDTAFLYGNTEQMRLNSTGLGIGTSSPAYKLDVRGGVIAGGNGTIVGGISYSTRPEIGAISNHPVGFITNNTTQMLLDTSGNLGLGVTPSAWISNTKAAQIGSFLSAWTGSNGSANISFGAYEGVAVNSYRYLTTGDAPTMYSQLTGAHRWYTAPSGTAGNAISFTQALTLDAGGNLLLGTTTVSGGRATIAAVANYNDLATGYSLVLSNSAGTGSASNPVNVGVIQFGNPIVTNSDLGRLSVVQESPSSGTQSSMRFFTNGGGGNTQTLERARITAGGEVYIAGTADQGAYNLQVNGTGVWGAGAYVNGSDERLKDNIQTLDDGLSVVSQLRPVTFQYKPEYSKDQSVQPGFIAQELQQAMEGKNYLQGVVQSGPEYLNVAYQNMIPILTKAIQEQQALITDLRARVAALEA